MAAQKNKGAKGFRPMAEINVVPYIDVMLVLLVIFMITTPLLTRGVDVNLPKTGSAKTLAQNQAEPIIVSVDTAAHYYLNISPKPEKPISTQYLQSLVARELNTSKNMGQKRPVLVKGDERVNYGAVINAMVLLKEAGADSVGLITDPLPQEKK